MYKQGQWHILSITVSIREDEIFQIGSNNVSLISFSVGDESDCKIYVSEIIQIIIFKFSLINTNIIK